MQVHKSEVTSHTEHLTRPPGLLAALAIVYAIRHTKAARDLHRQPIRLRVRPVLRGPLGRLMLGVTAL
jgi:hypothetical protein